VKNLLLNLTGLRATQLHGQLESMDWSRKMGAVKSLFIKKIFSTVHLQALPSRIRKFHFIVLSSNAIIVFY